MDWDLLKKNYLNKMVLILLIKKYIDKKVAQILIAKLSNFVKSEKQFCILCCICYPIL